MTTMTVNGRLGRDSELKYTSEGMAYLSLNVAYNYGRRDGEGNRPTQWVQATMWGKQAEALSPHLTKGSGVLLTLEDVHINEYQKSDGSTGSALRGRVIKFEFGMNSPRSDSNQQQSAPQPTQQQQQPVQQQVQQPVQQRNYQAETNGGAPWDQELENPF